MVIWHDMLLLLVVNRRRASNRLVAHEDPPGGHKPAAQQFRTGFGKLPVYAHPITSNGRYITLRHYPNRQDKYKLNN